ncbi:UDP-glucose 4-epimerase [hydrothermal vent metagenome]|uniref:UDP-glucose 4-epimerase n=1 Tax=hydrothermal vent metagenome TaxID=652676 RepID=A0A3B0TN53_9ZZZZ
MKIALTGGSGKLGKAIAKAAIKNGHQVVSIDRVLPEGDLEQKNIRFVQADLCAYEQLEQAFEGCDALLHMAAIPSPFNDPDHVVHNNNVVGNYNALRVAVGHGIKRICLASSVNAIGFAFSREAKFDYFPIDEDHSNYCEDAYSLSKWISEQQADSFARRYEDVSIASMRFHYVAEERADAAKIFTAENKSGMKQLWAYTRSDAAASACLLSLEADFKGHEAFYIVAPDTCVDVPSMELAGKFYPDVPIKGKLEGNSSFFSSKKAEQILGWRHAPGSETA